MKAIRLKTEYLNNPIGIDVKRPRLSWVCEGGKKQTAYRIIAKDDEQNVIWDSGKTDSSKMHLIPWGGEDLKSRQRVIWSVELWDEDGNKGDMSDEAFFELGLLDERDWKATWITGNYSVKRKTRYPVDCFRMSFNVDAGKEVIKARAYMSACGLYEGQLNGEKIGNFCLAPGHTDYRKRVQYQTADITSMIKSGVNDLFIMLADGWYRGSVGAWGLKNFYGNETKLLVQIEVYFSDGSKKRLCSDEKFEWTNDGPIRFADNKDGEIYEAAREEFKNVIWKKAKATKHNVVPTASNNFALTEHERFTDPKLIITPSGKKVLDFGQNIAGYIEFKVNA